jgi:hypothetical protein
MDRSFLLDEGELGMLGKPTPRGYATAPAIWSQSTPKGISASVVRARRGLQPAASARTAWARGEPAGAARGAGAAPAGRLAGE